MVNLTANDVLGGTEVQEAQSEKQEAIEWLRELLADGPVAAKKVRSDAEGAGLSWATVRRAKDALVIKPQKSAYHGGWEWRLGDAQHEDAQTIDSHMNTFEQHVEITSVNGNRPVEDAHYANMSALRPFELRKNREDHEYLPDTDGPGCTCLNCDGHFGTAAGWRAHRSRGRCTSRLNTLKTGGVR